jgi:hypothetical protein
MADLVAKRELRHAVRWRAWACVVLALLFLYNPFVSTPAMGSGLDVRHPASHRATVGSSELQHFSPTSKVAVVAVPEIDTGEFTLEAPVVFAVSFPPFQNELLPSQPIPSASQWFRPPPAH